MGASGFSSLSSAVAIVDYVLCYAQQGMRCADGEEVN
jgi:hypothetical protein